MTLSDKFFEITPVEVRGSREPGETTFKLAVVGSNAGGADVLDVTITATVTTNGVGDYAGEMTITGPSEQLCCMLSDGVFVQQVNEGKANWTYDDTVWGLWLFDGAAYASTDDAAPGYTVYIMPTVCEKGDDGVYYSIDWKANPVDEMTFTNTYTKSTTRPSENGTNTGTITSPQTGDNSNLAVWFALLAVSAAGVMGAGVYSKRRRSSR